MRPNIEPAIALLAFAAGCGDRSALNVLGSGAVEGGPSSSSGSPNSSSGSGSGSSGSGAGCDSPSCAYGGPGMTNCGSDGNDCCCTSLEVSGGTFYRTYDLETSGGPPSGPGLDGGPTGEADPATVSAFRLDKYLVTVGRFRHFVNAVRPADSGTGWLPAPGSGIHRHLNGGLGLLGAGVTSADAGVAYEPGWVASGDSNIVPTNANLACDVYATWTASPGENENLPINCVNWFEAYAFCIWDGGFLPSDAELEYAAAGGSRQREYPWGSIDPGTANEYAIYGDTSTPSPSPNGELCYYPTGTLVACTGVTNIAPVGTARLGAGLWGQLDLAGELSSWDLDEWILKPVDPCTDCTLVSGAGGRATRGGACDSPKKYLLPSSRGAGTPIVRTDAFGVRCARTP